MCYVTYIADICWWYCKYRIISLFIVVIQRIVYLIDHVEFYELRYNCVHTVRLNRTPSLFLRQACVSTRRFACYEKHTQNRDCRYWWELLRNLLSSSINVLLKLIPLISSHKTNDTHIISRFKNNSLQTLLNIELNGGYSNEMELIITIKLIIDWCYYRKILIIFIF